MWSLPKKCAKESHHFPMIVPKGGFKIKYPPRSKRTYASAYFRSDCTDYDLKTWNTLNICTQVVQLNPPTRFVEREKGRHFWRWKTGRKVLGTKTKALPNTKVNSTYKPYIQWRYDIKFATKKKERSMWDGKWNKTTTFIPDDFVFSSWN